MAILEHEVRSAAASSVTTLQRHAFTRDEYYAMGKAGLFDDMRVELIEGEIVDRTPIVPSHSAITNPLAEILTAAFGPGFAVRNQGPIALGDDAKPSDPQPDIAVVAGNWRDYIKRLPIANDVKLVVEVADSSLADDRTIKAALYAASGIPECWIVNLVDNQLEVYREPSESGFASTTIYRSNETVVPLHAGKSIRISDFMP